MIYEEESYIIDSIAENNAMLKYIVKVLNTYVINHHKENEEDFTRNVVANVVSELFTGNKK